MSKERLMAEVVLGRDGEVLVDTDTIQRLPAADVGWDDDEGDFEGEYDDDGDFEGDFEGDDDDDSEFGRRRNKRRRGSSNSANSGQNSKGRRGNRQSNRSQGGGKAKAKGDTGGMLDVTLSGKETITAAGSVILRIRVQHDFVLKDVVFKGTAAGTDLTAIYFAGRKVFLAPDGVDVTVYDSQSQLRDTLSGHRIDGGRDIELHFNTTSDSGVVKAALFGMAPKSQL